MQLRPARVPKVARFSANDGWWQVGEIVDGRPFGPWRTFRADGSPLFEARFDKKGRLQGTFRRFHPDGSIAREGSYKHGVPTGDHTYHRGPGDLFPTSDARAHQVVMRYDTNGRPKSRIVLDERGRELGAGDPQTGELDAQLATAKPDEFLASGVLPRVLATLPKAEEVPPDEFLLPLERAPVRRPLTAARFGELFGRPITPALRAWLDAFASGAPKLCGIRPARDGDVADGGNLIEALILEHQAAPGRASGLRELVSGVLAIGDASETARYVLSLCETGAEQPTDAVYVFDVAEDDMNGPVARTLDDFAYAVALTSAADAGGLSLDGVKKAYERLRGRVDLIAPMSGIEERALGEDEDGELVGDETKDHREGFHFRRPNRYPPYFLYRNRWVLQLLRGYPEAAAASFEPKVDGGLDDTRFERICKHASREIWVAFYWLIRSWVFTDPRLDTLLRVCSDTPSQLVRDCVALVRELAGGRKRLGDVADIGEVVAKFRALDPLNKKPDEDDEEEEEQEEEEADDEAGDDDATLERPPVPAALAPAVAVIDWARNEGYTRENLLMRDEVDAAALGLALRADPAVVPYLVQLVDEVPWLGEKFLEPWLDGDRAPIDVLLPAARRWIAADDKSAASCAIASRILARGGDPEDARAIGTVLESAFDALWHQDVNLQGRMALSALEEAMFPMCQAVAALGVPDELVPALEALVSAETHHVDDARGPAALALAAAGKGTDKILEGLRTQIGKKHGHRIMADQLLALASLGKGREAEIVALIENIPRIEHAAKVGQQLALYDLTRSGDVAEIFRAGLADERYSDSDTAKDRVYLLDLLAERGDAPAELARPFVHDRDIAVHRAAVRALTARGADVPAFTLYDPLYIGTLTRDQIHAGLADETGLYRGNLALWIAEHPDASSREPLVAWVRRIAAAGNFPKDGPPYYELRWILGALIALGDSEELFDELLQHDDRNIAGTALRYVDQLGPAVATGVAHVFVTDQHWKRGAAKEWLAKHHKDRAVVEALELFGLAVEDVTSQDEEDDE
jgi:hypothetical protein